MKIAVLTPYYKEDVNLIRESHESVLALRAKDIEVTHFLIADGFPKPEIDQWDAWHIKLPVSHGDAGDTPRAIGGAMAFAKGFDAVMMLDADNWYEPNHLSLLLAKQTETSADVVTTSRTICHLDGSKIRVCTESDGAKFNDTNCYLILRPAMNVMSAWGYKESKLGKIGDRIFWQVVKKRDLKLAHVTTPTVNYRAAWAIYYAQSGIEVPPASRLYAMLDGVRLELTAAQFKERFDAGDNISATDGILDKNLKKKTK